MNPQGSSFACAETLCGPSMSGIEQLGLLAKEPPLSVEGGCQLGACVPPGSKMIARLGQPSSACGAWMKPKGRLLKGIVSASCQTPSPPSSEDVPIGHRTIIAFHARCSSKWTGNSDDNGDGVRRDYRQ
ncbi:hypothetical protein GQ457_17G018580 [Hibiscus cannabinus]